MRLNLFNSVTEPKVMATVSLNSVFDMIKYGSDKKMSH